ncbi:hypothetical protein K440DRAFT_625033 [Wilcoxina mikolae CBS 423.85]|nr:hypothetical protein K440DRAFT_625033 [Wilcoxina mikolae CBS 423.85]
MERAVITPEPPGDDEEEGEGEEGMVATQKSLVQDLKTPKEDTATVAAEVEETPEIPAAKKDVTAAAATPNRDIAAPTPNKNDVTTLSITKISHHNHRRHDSFASVKSAISFTTIRTKHKHSRQLSTESVSSVLGEEMKRGYVRAIWLLEGVGGER